MTSPQSTNSRTFPIPSALRSIVNTMWREGGQRKARSNAWQAVCTDRLRAREREQARGTLGPPTTAVSHPAPPEHHGQ